MTHVSVYLLEFSQVIKLLFTISKIEVVVKYS